MLTVEGAIEGDGDVVIGEDGAADAITVVFDMTRSFLRNFKRSSYCCHANRCADQVGKTFKATSS